MSATPVTHFEQLRYEVGGHVATITLNRPDRLNAWTFRMASEIVEAFGRADADDDVRAVIVTGAGRAFCAGMDLEAGAAAFDPGDLSAGEVRRDEAGVQTLRTFECTKPVIAAVNGPAVGIGSTMLLPLDIRLASVDASFGFVFVRRGIVIDAASSWFLPRVVGMGQALEWALTGRVFGAEEALRGGLVRSIHPPDELLPAAQALAHEIADNAAPVSVAVCRRLLWDMAGADHPMVAHRADSRALSSRVRSADMREGVASFLEKRPPAFPDRVSDGLPVLADPSHEEPRWFG
jgi:enoyl-CoA hydratase/carnithine racemase